ncbi:DUF2946 family protein [Leptothrix discophora]|uniref:DUF2946 domain-containing protein n=1 Tax=Leptothrix discophora TaxID=89 RepID=A0ABT9FZU2_LEPDI|nr:DUF2946 family protein [Leptothrix discophora]MDP4299685.1 hypothetical protein [Leptothrix discophora]
MPRHGAVPSARGWLRAWLIVLALLWSGAMPGWGLVLQGSSGLAPSDLSDWCATAVPDRGDTGLPATDGTGLPALEHGQVHCALCLGAATLPDLPVVAVPAVRPVIGPGWTLTIDPARQGLQPWRQPHPRGPPASA